MSKEPTTFNIYFLGETVFSGVRNRLEETHQPTIEGAMAALETFDHALNGRSLDLFRQIWLDDPLIQLNNPISICSCSWRMASDPSSRLYRSARASRAVSTGGARLLTYCVVHCVHLQL